ncbi:Protein PHLOEM PROTEIN 2-LIKE A1 [Acorus gramineus]|uniref:Protein PHLOEM PROTEIN 2-LIKE A1 n=1 Tax=Acorus gramineus TaxID=55184 RepID=A0AAV9B863_ACOGR|nr:Protein PHLOEM PROTEIN 2-LIKE A1 [Acorus gramineus]
MGCFVSILSLLSPDQAEEEFPEVQYHKFKDIVKDADDKSDLLQRVHPGIYLKNKEMKYWVDESGSNCFMCYASDEDVEVACLMDICWLAAEGDFDVSLLSPGVNYEVVFILTMKDFSHGWDNIVTLRLERPDNTEHEEEIILDPEELKGQWGELVVGEFNSGVPDSKGRVVAFKLSETTSGQWKGGLVIKGVLLQPVRGDSPS